MYIYIYIYCMCLTTKSSFKCIVGEIVAGSSITIAVIITSIMC